MGSGCILVFYRWFGRHGIQSAVSVAAASGDHLCGFLSDREKGLLGKEEVVSCSGFWPDVHAGRICNFWRVLYGISPDISPAAAGDDSGRDAYFPCRYGDWVLVFPAESEKKKWRECVKQLKSGSNFALEEVE